VFVFVFVFVLVTTVGRTVSTLAALSTLEGETMGMAYCVCGVSGRLSEETDAADAVRECVSSSSLSMAVPSPLIPVFCPALCRSSYFYLIRALDLHSLDF
jgi:hypothetical protein